MSATRTAIIGMILCAACFAGVHAVEPDGGASAEAELKVLLNAVRANRKAMVAVNLHLEDGQAAAFWPVYDRYQTELNANGDRQIALVERYIASFPGTSDEEAMALIKEYLAADAERVALRQKYLGEFAGVIPGSVVARLYQIENKLDAVTRYDLAATIPVLE